jgi:hypothetical protein
MSIFSNFPEATKAFCTEISHGLVEWEERQNNQYVSQITSQSAARTLATLIAKTLNLNVNDIGTAESSSGLGTRVVIWSIPRFATALELYQRQKVAASLEQMQSSAITHSINMLENAEHMQQLPTEEELAAIFDRKTELNNGEVISNFSETANAICAEICHEQLEWEKRPSQYVSKKYEQADAFRLATLIATALNLTVGKDEIGVAKSKGGDGTRRVVIWDIPRFARALESYQQGKAAASTSTSTTTTTSTFSTSENEEEPTGHASLANGFVSNFSEDATTFDCTVNSETGPQRVDWERRKKQFVSKNTYEQSEAFRLATLIAKTLNLTVGKDDIGIAESRHGGTRVVIWDIPRFARALESYQQRLNQP